MNKGWLSILVLICLIYEIGEKTYGQTTTGKLQGVRVNQSALSTKRQADSLFNIGSNYQDTQAYQQSLLFFKSSLELYQSINDGRKIGDCFSYMAMSYYFLGDVSKAITSFEKSAKVFEAIGYKKGVASTLNNVGSVYNGLGNYLKALNHYRQAAYILSGIGDKEGLAVANHSIGIIYFKVEDYANAMKYFNHSYAVYKQLNKEGRIAQILNGIGNIYAKQINYEKAYESLNKSLMIADERRDKQLQIEALSSLGDLFYKQADYTRALTYYNRCLAYSSQIGNVQNQSESQIAIGNIMHRLGNSKDAVEKCRDGLKLAEKLGSVSIKKNGCDCLYESYKALNNSQQALRYYEQANTLEDSLNLAETANKVMGMEFQKQQLVDSIAYVKKEHTIQLKHKEDVQRREKQRNMIIMSLCFILLIAAGLWTQLNYVRKSRTAIKTEKDRSEALLLNILPADIAEELKEKGHVNARDYDLVSILFTDFKSFTQTAEKMTPQSLVEEINTCFKAFDLIMERYQIEKIKTIGDAYMAAGGIPNADENALKNSVLAGLEMQAFMQRRYHENQLIGRPAFEMRLGIHAGPIVAGIVGVKKFQYDVWGDTVNTASRMESSGAVGKVNISETLYQLIKHESCFAFEHRGSVNAKGKGEISMYFVEKSSVAQLVV